MRSSWFATVPPRLARGRRSACAVLVVLLLALPAPAGASGADASAGLPPGARAATPGDGPSITGHPDHPANGPGSPASRSASPASGPSSPGAASRGPEFLPDQLAVTLRRHHRGKSAAALLRARGVDARTERRVTAAHRGVTVAPADLPAAMARLAADPAVAKVERVPLMRVDAPPLAPDDPLWDQQWGLRQTHVDQAWTTTTGAADVTVAVLDTGVDEVADLQGRLLPGRNIVDGNDDPADPNGHGTMVATVLAGAGDNGVAGAGACWDCRVLPVRVLGDHGAGSALDVAAGIHWAVEHGADIINLSLGSATTIDAIDDAVVAADAAGVLVVAAAGNNGKFGEDPPPDPRYPAALPTVLSVGANGRDGRRYYWSNHGDHVDVAAPGCGQGQNRHREGEFCGTSNSAPIAAGIAALGMSHTPGLSAGQWRDVLTSTSVPTGDWLVAGRVDALALLSRDDTEPPSTEITAPAAGSTVTGRFEVTAAADDNYGVAWVELLADGEVVGDRLDRRPYAWSLWAGSLGAGWSSLTVRASDGRNKALSPDVRVFVGDDEPPPPPPPPPPPRYTAVDLGVLGDPGTTAGPRSYPVALNNAGQAVGGSTTSVPNRVHAFLWDDGVLSSLNDRITQDDHPTFRADGINDHGHVVGRSRPEAGSRDRAAILDGAQLTNLEPAFGSASENHPYDINDHGLVVGTSRIPAETPYRAILWENGEARDLGTLGGSGDSPWSVESRAHAVNDRGQVVGFALTPHGYPGNAFLWEDGVMHDLGTLTGSPSETSGAYDINDHGQIAGWGWTGHDDSQAHAILWDEDGVMHDLGAWGEPGWWRATFGWGINNAGTVVGSARVPELGYVFIRAWVWEHGEMHDLNDLVSNMPAGMALRSADAINDDGTVLAEACVEPCLFGSSTNGQRAYLLVPEARSDPEPVPPPEPNPDPEPDPDPDPAPDPDPEPVPPSVTLTSPAAGALLRGVVTLAADVSADTGSGVAVDRVEFLVDGSVVGGATTAPYVASWDTAAVGDGSRTVRARVTDTGGGAATSEPRAVTVDNTPPDTRIDSGPSGTVKMRDRDVTFRFSSPDGDTVGFECSFNGAAFTSCSSPVTHAKLQRGTYTFAVRAVDAAGNRDPTPASRTWTVG